MLVFDSLFPSDSFKLILLQLKFVQNFSLYKAKLVWNSSFSALAFKYLNHSRRGCRIYSLHVDFRRSIPQSLVNR